MSLVAPGILLHSLDPELLQVVDKACIGRDPLLCDGTKNFKKSTNIYDE
jgi:hypothetical protein